MADQFKFVQAQTFILAGSGAVATATSIILSSMTQIDGSTTLAMTDFGSIGFGTLEPNNSTQEEQICFTGITQNANGTATLTGVSTVLTVAPYTQTSGLSKSHPGGAKFIISNTAGFYDKMTAKADDETVTGKWTFPNDDVSNAGIATDTDTAVATAFVTLGQLSRQAISGASNASTTVKGIVQLPHQSDVDNKSTTGSTGALFSVTPDKMRATKYHDYVVDTGTPTAYAIAPTPTVTLYSAGQKFIFQAIHTNTSTTPTLSVSGLATKTLKTSSNGAVPINFIRTNSVVGVVYDGTNFQISEIARPRLSQEGLEIYAVGTSGTTAYAVGLVPALTNYTAGLIVQMKADVSLGGTGGGATLNVNSLGAKNIKRYSQGALVNPIASDIIAGVVYPMTYDGTQFQLKPSSPYNSGLGTWASAATGANTQVTRDSFLVGYVNIPAGNANTTTVATDSSATPSTVRNSISARDASYDQVESFCCPVKKNDYYNITVGASQSIAAFIIPIN